MGTSSKRPWWRLIAPVIAFLVVATAGGIVGSALVVPVVAGAGVVVDKGVSAFDAQQASLTTTGLPRTSVMLDATGAPIAYFYDENRTPVPLAQIATTLQDAVVAVEDSRFYQHGPVDPKGLLRAAANDVTGGSTEGASTLTQQYVKNVLLQQALAANDTVAAQAATARTAARKLQELRLAITLEQQLTKKQILERYLNIVYFDQQSYGAQAAAMRYFDVPAAKLTLPQAALLAGMIHDPSADDPLTHPVAARTRRDVVLTDMHQQKLITDAQYATALKAPVTLHPTPLANGCAPAGADGYFCQYVMESLLSSPAYSALGTTRAQRLRSVQAGGLVIRTSLDPTAQKAAVRAVDAAIPATDSSGLAATSVTVEPGTGAVTAMAEDRTYSVSSGPGQTSVNYATDNTLGGSRGFQTGSSFKPFTLATWLATGHSLTDTVDATKRAFPFSDFTACGQRLGGGQYSPGNSEGTETGPMSVLQATSDSVNVAYVAMEAQLDLCTIAATAQSLGVHLAAPESECSPGSTPTTDLPTCLPSLTLGVKDIAPLTMAAAYAAFADGGTYCPPLPVRSISRAASPDGVTASQVTFTPRCTQALTPDVAAGVNTALSRVLIDGTASAVGPLQPWESAGKTGTTDGPYDTWFVGYTAQRSTAVWVGDPGRLVNGSYQRRRLTNIDVAGRYYSTVFGASIAAPIWKDVMTAAMHGLPTESLHLQQMSVPAPQNPARTPVPTPTQSPVSRPSPRPTAGPSRGTPTPRGSTPAQPGHTPTPGSG